MIEGPPLEFKCLDENDKTVGFKKFNNDKGEWRTSEKGNLWYLNHRINYKKMRQWTGHFDIHGEKIYFGDKLRDKPGNIFVVKMDNGQIIGDISAFHIGNKWARQFEDMELVK